MGELMKEIAVVSGSNALLPLVCAEDGDTSDIGVAVSSCEWERWISSKAVVVANAGGNISSLGVTGAEIPTTDTTSLGV